MTRAPVPVRGRALPPGGDIRPSVVVRGCVLLVGVLLLAGTLPVAFLSVPAGAQAEPDADTAGEVRPTTPTTATLPPELGNIIGSPDPGPRPEDAGDRGGWAQLLVLGVTLTAVGLVLRHLFRSASRGGRTATG